MARLLKYNSAFLRKHSTGIFGEEHSEQLSHVFCDNLHKGDDVGTPVPQSCILKHLLLSGLYFTHWRIIVH